MIKFLFKGIIRDRSRSLFPLLVVAAGVSLTVLLYSWIQGIGDDMIRANANFYTGHVKVTTRAYAEEIDQMPNDLALLNVDSLLTELRSQFPALQWTPRIRFGGLLDKPDEAGETLVQGPIAGMAVDLFSDNSPEKKTLNLRPALVRGHLPSRAGDILISDRFCTELNINPGDTVTLISSGMYGGLAMANFRVAGTIRFGVTAMDRGMMIADLCDIQKALDMQDAAGEILGFFMDGFFHQKKAAHIVQTFNSQSDSTDDFAPVMLSLRDQHDLGEMLDMVSSLTGVFIGLFIFVMSIVLWNAGLMNSIRRYGEIGVRLAIGEDKGHIYKTMLVESVIIAFIGTLLGTILGLAISYFLQYKGINIGYMMKNASMLLFDVVRARVTATSYVIGFIPGLVSTTVGTAISGIGIYRRQTSQLFKELEV